MPTYLPIHIAEFPDDRMLWHGVKDLGRRRRLPPAMPRITADVSLLNRWHWEKIWPLQADLWWNSSTLPVLDSLHPTLIGIPQ